MNSLIKIANIFRCVALLTLITIGLPVFQFLVDEIFWFLLTEKNFVSVRITINFYIVILLITQAVATGLVCLCVDRRVLIPHLDKANTKRVLFGGIVLFLGTTLSCLLFEFIFQTVRGGCQINTSLSMIVHGLNIILWRPALLLFIPLSALCEELLFRRMILERLMKKAPQMVAVLLCSLSFGFIHWLAAPQDVINNLFVMVDSLIFSVVYLLYGRSLWASVGMHCGSNLTSFWIDGYDEFIISPSKFHFVGANAQIGLDYTIYRAGVELVLFLLLYLVLKKEQSAKPKSTLQSRVHRANAPVRNGGITVQ